MASSNPSSNDSSRVATPNPRFTSQASTAADLLASQTVGLVHLSDFRKRRAEALEQKEREASGGSFGRFAPSSTPASASGAATPNSVIDGVSTPHGPPPKKKRKQVAKGKLSFGLDDEEPNNDAESNIPPGAQTQKTNHNPDGETSGTSPAPAPPFHNNVSHIPSSSKKKARLGPNASLPGGGAVVAPKAMTKSALLREAQTREQLRKEFLAMQEAVKATEIIIPFVFYDGTNIPGGACKVKKGDHVWLFLDRSRKVGAELGVGGGAGGGGGEKAKSRNEWARVGVDDLMLVRGEIIIPHHYELYYFIINKTLGPNGKPLFDYAATVDPPSPSSSPSPSPPPAPNNNSSSSSFDPISSKTKKTPNHNNNNSGVISKEDSHLEGASDDPHFTKVVDRRWYERNKHIFPASVWEEFEAGKDYKRGGRRDKEGNAFFFS